MTTENNPKVKNVIVTPSLEEVMTQRIKVTVLTHIGEKTKEKRKEDKRRRGEIKSMRRVSKSSYDD